MGSTSTKIKKEHIKQHGYESYGVIGVPMPGELNPFFGKKHTEETKRKISRANTGKSRPGELAGFYGKHHTESAKQRIRDANLGSNNHNYGKPMSEELKRKQRESHLGKTLSEEHKQLLKDMWSKPVVQLNPLGSTVHQRFSFGALSIGRNLHISGKKIWQLCCSNSQEEYEGYIWKFIEDYDKLHPSHEME